MKYIIYSFDYLVEHAARPNLDLDYKNFATARLRNVLFANHPNLIPSNLVPIDIVLTRCWISEETFFR